MVFFFKNDNDIKKIAFFLAMFFLCPIAFSQEKTEEKAPTEEKKIEPVPPESRFSAEIDVVYPNLSRGILLNSMRLAYQATVSYDFTDKLTFGVWITTNLSNDASAYNEYDFTLDYQVTPVFGVALGDYYSPATKYANIEYGEIRTPFTDFSIYSAQAVELCLLFDFTPKGFPLDFQWDTLIYGNDFKDVVTDSNGNVISKKRAYSSYSEVGYTYIFKKSNIYARPFIGAAVINSAGYYGYFRNGKTGFSFINVGFNVSKNFVIRKKYTLPFFIQYTYNEDGNYNSNRSELTYSFLSAGLTFIIK